MSRTQTTSPDTLRSTLRLQLTAVHEDIDAAFSALDLTDDADYVTFLRAHHSALSQMQAATLANAPTPAHSVLADLLRAIEADLEAMGFTPFAPPATTRQLHPMASDYILYGSRLGNKIIARRRAKAMSEAGREDHANRYLDYDFDIRLWQDYVRETSQIPAQSPQTDIIIADAAHCFTWFSAALTRQTTPQTVLTGGA